MPLPLDDLLDIQEEAESPDSPPFGATELLERNPGTAFSHEEILARTDGPNSLVRVELFGLRHHPDLDDRVRSLWCEDAFFYAIPETEGGDR